MRKYMLILLVLLAAWGLVACGGGTATPTAEPVAEAAPTEAPAEEAAPTDAPAAEGETQVLRLATTTSTADSGLLDAILPGFEAEHNARVDVVAVLSLIHI